MTSMISNAIFLGDPYRWDQAVNINKLQRLFLPVLRQLGISANILATEINYEKARDKWIPHWKISMDEQRPFEISSKALEGSVILGFEVPDYQLAYLNRLGIPWVNFCIHPLRFLDDLYFEVTTSFPYDMQKNSASTGLIDVCVQALSMRHLDRGSSNSIKTLAIFGQDFVDRSIYFDKQFRRLSDYLPKLDLLADKHERILYKPHPAWAAPDIAELMIKRYSAQVCSTASIYDLFITEGIQTACAISSSVLTEAPYFGINAEYLESRAKRYGPAVSYKALLDDSQFWEALFPQSRNRNSTTLKLSSVVPDNYLRRLFWWWGHITDEMRLEARIGNAEAQASQASERAGKAETLSMQAGERATEAETQATQANERASKAETQSMQANERAVGAESQAAQANGRANQAVVQAAQANERANQAVVQAAQANERASQAVVQAAQANERASQAEAQAAQANERASQAEAAAHNAWTQYQVVINSRSWRMTTPLRWAMSRMKWFTRGFAAWVTLRPGSRPRRTARLALLHLRNWVVLRPRVKAWVWTLLQRLPRLKAWLWRLHYANSTQAMPTSTSSIVSDISTAFECSSSDDSLEHLPPNARRIYADLKSAVARQQKKGN